VQFHTKFLPPTFSTVAEPLYRLTRKAAFGHRGQKKQHFTLICSWCARLLRFVPFASFRRRCIVRRDWGHIVSQPSGRKWTTNGEHFEIACDQSAQLQPDSKGSFGYHLCSKEVLSVVTWKKVYFVDAQSASKLLQFIDDSRSFVLNVVVVALTGRKRFRNVLHWSFASVRMAVKQCGANPDGWCISGDS